MRFLRTAPTRRVLAVTVGVVVAIASCTAIALAATSGGPVPSPKPLAQAIHDALSDGPVAGITAQVTFTSNLISSGDVQETDPLLTGADGRLWLTKDHLRLELQSDNGDAQVVVNNRSFWVYDPTSNTVYEGMLPAGDSSERSGTAEPIPTVARIEGVLAKLAAHVDGLTATPADVAGQPAYSVRVSPAQSGGMLGSIELAWDAVHGVPLSIAVYAKGDASPVLALQATSISYGSVSPSDVDIAPPSSATVVNLGDLGDLAGAHAGRGASYSNPTAPQSASGATTSAATLAQDGFTDPASAGGLSLTASRAVGAEAASLTYGRGLAAVVVLERRSRPGDSGSSANTGTGNAGSGDAGNGAGLSLPTETIDGNSVTELSTELGTLLEFDRGGVSYIVAGSVPLSTANAVAAAL